MRGVQRFGEKRAFRRIIGWSCRLGVQSSNEKWLWILGLIAREIARRTHDLEQAGGGIGIRTNGTVLLFTEDLADLKRQEFLVPSIDNF